MEAQNEKYAGAQMLVRRPVDEVFEAFIDPAVTRNFWFTKSSGRLEVNKKVTWQWEMYGVSTTVTAKEIIKNEKIVLQWNDPPANVEFSFQSLKDDSTYVVVKEWGYDKQGDDLLAVIRDSTGGFTTVLDGLKAFLEHGINLGLIADKFPGEVTRHGNSN